MVVKFDVDSSDVPLTMYLTSKRYGPYVKLRGGQSYIIFGGELEGVKIITYFLNLS